jgi:hypothetical protein
VIRHPARVTVRQLVELVCAYERSFEMLEQVCAEARNEDQWWRLQKRMRLLTETIDKLADEIQVLDLQRRLAEREARKRA